MKKAISLTLLLIGIILIYRFAFFKLKTNHEVDYLIKKDNYKFNVNEKFENNNYYFTIKNDDYNYILSISDMFNKKTEVITDILSTSDNNLSCIYPIYKSKSDKLGTIVCSDKTNIYSYESVKNNDLVIKFLDYLKQNNYNISNFEEENNNNISEINGIQYYKKSINEILTVWDYRGINIINNESHYKTEILSFDRYENTLGIIVDKYYIFPNYINNKLFEIDGFHIIDLKSNERKLIKLNFVMSDKSYINGIVDNKLYIFDKNNMKQIEINIENKQIKIVSTKDFAKYYDNEWIDRNIYDFKDNELKFNHLNKNDISKFNINNIYQSDDSYYLYENDTMYQVYKNNLDKKIILFYGKDLKEIKIIDNNIYFINNDTLYRYDRHLIKKLLTYSELKYNYKNIINIYK